MWAIGPKLLSSDRAASPLEPLRHLSLQPHERLPTSLMDDLLQVSYFMTGLCSHGRFALSSLIHPNV